MLSAIRSKKNVVSFQDVKSMNISTPGGILTSLLNPDYINEILSFLKCKVGKWGNTSPLTKKMKKKTGIVFFRFGFKTEERSGGRVSGSRSSRTAVNPARVARVRRRRTGRAGPAPRDIQMGSSVTRTRRNTLI